MTDDEFNGADYRQQQALQEHAEWIAEYERGELSHFPAQSPKLQEKTTMPKVGDMVQSKYLKQSDVPDPVIVTIQGVKQANVARDDAPPEMKWLIKFREFEKPMVLNPTNIMIASQIIGSDDTDDWRGREIVLYADPSISYQGKITGGLRFRGQQKNPVKAAHTTGFEDMSDDVPF